MVGNVSADSSGLLDELDREVSRQPFSGFPLHIHRVVADDIYPLWGYGVAQPFAESRERDNWDAMLEERGDE